MNLKISTICYQRNGICGTGFYAISFQHDGRAMVGMVVTKSDDDPLRATQAEFCGVVDPSDPTQCWRGDHFEAVLLPACLAADAGLHGSDYGPTLQLAQLHMLGRFER